MCTCFHVNVKCQLRRDIFSAPPGVRGSLLNVESGQENSARAGLRCGVPFDQALVPRSRGCSGWPGLVAFVVCISSLAGAQ